MKLDCDNLLRQYQTIRHVRFYKILIDLGDFIMTYAAQLRSLSKSVSAQQAEEGFYDINSLRIICKYFVGSIVSVKTADEINEGVLHTISHNKICMTLVTTAKIDNPEIIIDISSNKLINLSDVLLIQTSNSGLPDVTVKGKFIRNCSQKNEKPKINHKTETKSIYNGKTNKKQIEPQITIEKKHNQKSFDKKNDNNTDNDNCNDTCNKPIDNNPTIKESKKLDEDNIETVSSLPSSSKTVNEKFKKSFSFNPNAPEFKPRSNITFSDGGSGQLIFSPHLPQYPPVFPPNSAPAIFVPNIFFYAPPNNIDGTPFDAVTNNCSTSPNMNHQSEINTEPSCSNSIGPDDQFVHKPASELHIGNQPPLSFPHVVPLFPPLPIFVPNTPYKYNNLPYSPGSNNATNQESEIGTSTDNIESNEVEDHNELLNPSNWPPLPNKNNNNNNSDNQKNSNSIITPTNGNGNNCNNNTNPKASQL